MVAMRLFQWATLVSRSVAIWWEAKSTTMMAPAPKTARWIHGMRSPVAVGAPPKRRRRRLRTAPGRAWVDSRVSLISPAPR